MGVNPENGLPQSVGIVSSAPAWAPATTYAAGAIVTYNGARYFALSQFTSGASFNPANWQQISSATLDQANLTALTNTVGRHVYQGTTYRKAAIAIRHDDGQKTDLAIEALEKARGIPAGFAIITNIIGAAAGTIFDAGNNLTSTNGQMTSTDLLAVQADGNEIMCHTATHNTAPPDFPTFVAEAIASKTTLTSLLLFVNSFVPPGDWGTTPKFHFISDNHYASDEGMALRTSYIAADGYVQDGILGDNYRRLPSQRVYGTAHLDGTALTSAQLQVYVDTCIQYGFAIEILFHTWLFDTGGGNITTADYTTFLNYLQTKRDAGLLDLLTPTGLNYAVQSDSKINLLRDGTFQEQASVGFWTITGAPVGVIAAGGHTAGNAYQVNSANYAVQRFASYNRPTMRFEAWAKPVGATCLPRVIVRATNSADSFNWTSVDTKPGSIAGWTKVAFNFGGHPSALNIKVWLLAEAASASDVQWSDVTVFPI